MCLSLVWVSVCVPFLKGPVSIHFTGLNLEVATLCVIFQLGILVFESYFIISLNIHFSRTPALQQFFWTYQILNCTGYTVEHWNNLSYNLYFTNLLFQDIGMSARCTVLSLALPFQIGATYLTNNILIGKESRIKFLESWQKTSVVYFSFTSKLRIVLHSNCVKVSWRAWLFYCYQIYCTLKLLTF